MTHKPRAPTPQPLPGRAAAPIPTHPQTTPAEPLEVLGRHKNDGQKDHKGAR